MAAVSVTADSQDKSQTIAAYTDLNSSSGGLYGWGSYGKFGGWRFTLDSSGYSPLGTKLRLSYALCVDKNTDFSSYQSDFSSSLAANSLFGIYFWTNGSKNYRHELLFGVGQSDKLGFNRNSATPVYVPSGDYTVTHLFDFASSGTITETVTLTGTGGDWTYTYQESGWSELSLKGIGLIMPYNAGGVDLHEAISVSKTSIKVENASARFGTQPASCSVLENITFDIIAPREFSNGTLTKKSDGSALGSLSWQAGKNVYHVTLPAEDLGICTDQLVFKADYSDGSTETAESTSVTVTDASLQFRGLAASYSVAENISFTITAPKGFLSGGLYAGGSEFKSFGAAAAGANVSVSFAASELGEGTHALCFKARHAAAAAEEELDLGSVSILPLQKQDYVTVTSETAEEEKVLFTDAFDVSAGANGLKINAPASAVTAITALERDGDSTSSTFGAAKVVTGAQSGTAGSYGNVRYEFTSAKAAEKFILSYDINLENVSGGTEIFSLSGKYVNASGSTIWLSPAIGILEKSGSHAVLCGDTLGGTLDFGKWYTVQHYFDSAAGKLLTAVLDRENGALIASAAGTAPVGFAGVNMIAWNMENPSALYLDNVEIKDAAISLKADKQAYQTASDIVLSAVIPFRFGIGKLTAGHTELAQFRYENTNSYTFTVAGGNLSKGTYTVTLEADFNGTAITQTTSITLTDETIPTDLSAGELLAVKDESGHPAVLPISASAPAGTVITVFLDGKRLNDENGKARQLTADRADPTVYTLPVSLTTKDMTLGAHTLSLLSEKGSTVSLVQTSFYLGEKTEDIFDGVYVTRQGTETACSADSVPYDAEQIRIALKKALKPASAAGKLSLAYTGGAAIPLDAASYDEATQSLILKPSAALTAGRELSLTIDGSVRYDDGSALGCAAALRLKTVADTGRTTAFNLSLAGGAVPEGLVSTTQLTAGSVIQAAVSYQASVSGGSATYVLILRRNGRIVAKDIRVLTPAAAGGTAGDTLTVTAAEAGSGYEVSLLALGSLADGKAVYQPINIDSDGIQ